MFQPNPGCSVDPNHTMPICGPPSGSCQTMHRRVLFDTQLPRQISTDAPANGNRSRLNPHNWPLSNKNTFCTLESAQLWLRLDGPNTTLGFDNMGNRAVKGTTDRESTSSSWKSRTKQSTLRLAHS